MHRVLMMGAVGVLGLALTRMEAPLGEATFSRDCLSGSEYRVCLAQGAGALRAGLVEGAADVSRSLEIPGHDPAMYSSLASKLRGGDPGLGASGPLE